MVVAASWAMNVTRFPVSMTVGMAVCMCCIWCMCMALGVPIVLRATHRGSPFWFESQLRLRHVQV